MIMPITTNYSVKNNYNNYSTKCLNNNKPISFGSYKLNIDDVELQKFIKTLSGTDEEKEVAYNTIKEYLNLSVNKIQKLVKNFKDNNSIETPTKEAFLNYEDGKINIGKFVINNDAPEDPKVLFTSELNGHEYHSTLYTWREALSTFSPTSGAPKLITKPNNFAKDLITEINNDVINNLLELNTVK